MLKKDTVRVILSLEKEYYFLYTQHISYKNLF